jgi:hypothetical protein
VQVPARLRAAAGWLPRSLLARLVVARLPPCSWVAGQLPCWLGSAVLPLRLWPPPCDLRGGLAWGCGGNGCGWAFRANPLQQHAGAKASTWGAQPACMPACLERGPRLPRRRFSMPGAAACCGSSRGTSGRSTSRALRRTSCTCSPAATTPWRAGGTSARGGRCCGWQGMRTTSGQRLPTQPATTAGPPAGECLGQDALGMVSCALLSIQGRGEAAAPRAVPGKEGRAAELGGLAGEGSATALSLLPFTAGHGWFAMHCCCAWSPCRRPPSPACVHEPQV